jgi:hypothetical protein
MKVLFYIHWNESELSERIEELDISEFEVRSHWREKEQIKWGDPLPDVVIVSLDRLPSYGRQYAHWLSESKKRTHIPLIFVDGADGIIRENQIYFPNALYCSSEELNAVLYNIFQ